MRAGVATGGLASFAVLLSALAGAAELRGLEGVDFKADHYETDQAKGIYVGIGNVRFAKADTLLTADSIVVWINDSEAFAQGHVVYVQGARKVVCERAFINWRENKGLMIDADLLPAETPREVTWYLHSPEVKQLRKKEFEARDAIASTCDFAKPHTWFRASTIRYADGDSITAENVSYWVRGMPVGWLPVAYQDLQYSWPKVDIQFGSSENFGTFLLSDIGFDVSKYVKMNFEVDFMSDRGVGYGVDLSYNIHNDIKGFLETYWLRDTGEDRHDIGLGTTDRYKFRFVHQQDVPEGWEFDFIFQRWSDAGFREEFFNDDYKTGLPIENRLYAKHTLADNVAVYFNTEWQVNEFFDTTEYLPQVGVNVFSKPLFGTGLLWSSHAEFANIRRDYSNLRLRPGESLANWLDDMFEADYSLPPMPLTPQEFLSDDQRFARFDVYNELSYPMSIGIFRFEPFVGARQTYYSKTLEDEGGGWRQIFDYGFRLATQFWKSWDNVRSETFQLNGLRHIITPEIRFLGVNVSSGSPDDLIQTDNFYATNPPTVFGWPYRPYLPYDTTTLAFGDINEIMPQKVLSLGLRNRLQTRRAEKVVDFIDLDMAVDYYFDDIPPRNGIPGLDSGAQIFRTDLRFNPVEGVNYFLDFEYNLSGANFNPAVDSGGNSFEVVNTGVRINTSEQWALYLANRYEQGVTNNIQVAFDRKLSEKWAVRLALDYNTRSSQTVDASVTFQRNMHEWMSEIQFGNDQGGLGQFFFIRFRPKRPGEMAEGFKFSRAVSGRWARNLTEYSFE